MSMDYRLLISTPVADKDQAMLRTISAGRLPPRLPFFYGWVIVAAVFVTMGIGVNTRTAFSLLFPPILDEFGWERGVTAGAFSFGFLISAGLSPMLGRLMDRRGPRLVIEMGVGLMAAGMFLAPLTSEPWHLYLTLGVLVGGGGVCLSYSGQSLFLPRWFVRRRGLAMSLAFSGVGVGSIILLPWVQLLIEQGGWRAACWALGIVLVAVLAPLNLLLRRRPEDLGLVPDGAVSPRTPAAGPPILSTRYGQRLDIAPGDQNGPFLVDSARVFLRPLRLVRGAGAPDEILDRNRVRPARGRLGFGVGEPPGDPRADCPRPHLRPHWARVGLDGR